MGLVAAAILLLVYGAIFARIWLFALDALAHPPRIPADAALVLGNRAFRDGQPNPCLTGRVDTALMLAKAGLVRQLAMSGGVDEEDGRVEAQVMRRHAVDAGFSGTVLMEPLSSSTRQNLVMSRSVLKAAGVRSVIVVSEPFHLWRVRHLARALHFDRDFDVQFAAAPTPCWQHRGMVSRGALREPLAIVNNAAHGYFR